MLQTSWWLDIFYLRIAGSAVVELVKLMPWRQAKSPLKITTAEQRSASHIS